MGASPRRGRRRGVAPRSLLRAPIASQDAAVATALFAALKIARSPAAAPATAAFVAGRLYGWVSSQWTEGAGALNALFLFADVFNRRGLQSYSDESDAHFVAHLAERREHFATLARTAVPREEVSYLGYFELSESELGQPHARWA